jgi:carboxymethylenebutenolidase
MSGEMIQFSSNGSTCSGYLSIPESGKGPGVIVIQEWWGLVDHIKDVCDRFASEGYVALAPDLYHGKSTKSPDEAGKLMMALRIDEAEKDLRGAVQYLRNHPATVGERVGIIGFCMGGALSFYAASKNKEIGACVVCYGIHPNVKPDLVNLEAPVLGIYAENDRSVPPEAVRKLEGQLKALEKTVEFQIYPGTDHAFFNDTRKEVYNEAAAKDSWNRVLDFFKKYLGA